MSLAKRTLVTPLSVEIPITLNILFPFLINKLVLMKR
jgi:hypothetical protein